MIGKIQIDRWRLIYKPDFLCKPRLSNSILIHVGDHSFPIFMKV